MTDPGDSTVAAEEAAAAASEGGDAAEASDSVTAAAAAEGAPALAATVRPGKGRSGTASRQLPAAQPSRPRRQLSRLESLDSGAAAATKQPSSKPARQSKKAPKKVTQEEEEEKEEEEEEKDPLVTPAQATAYTQRVWEGFHGAGSEAVGWGKGRRGTAGEVKGLDPYKHTVWLY
jgi:hypothetical protein